MTMSKTESGKLGAIKSLGWTHEQKRIRIEKYNLNPSKCKFCKKSLPYEKRNLEYCNHSCCASFNNKGVRRHGKAPGKCLQCKKECVGKYCSRKCHRIFEWNIKKESINKNGLFGPNDYTSRRNAKKYLIEKNGHMCSICKTKEWMGKPIPLISDHINGNHNDNRIENIRLVCGNCDMQLVTFTGKNKGNGRLKRREYDRNNAGVAERSKATVS